MITLAENLEYNTDIPFEEQSDTVKEWIKTTISKIKPIEEFEPAGKVNRVVLQKWDFGTFKIEKSYMYPYPSDSPINGIIGEEKIILK